jgi:hypothetical protein
MKDQQEKTVVPTAEEKSGLFSASLQRRSFLRFAGAGVAGAALLAVGCKKDDDDDNRTVFFGSGDVAILNYAYALEQLEAAFYKQVIDTPFNGMGDDLRALFTDIYYHEVAHREFFKKALANDAIGSLEVNFSGINFNNRDSVLDTAKAFEDLGVSAYNGAGKYLKSSDYLLLAGKIASVEARHAAAIRDLISNGSFADTTVVDASGLEISKTPRQVIPIAQKFLKTQISAEGFAE